MDPTVQVALVTSGVGLLATVFTARAEVARRRVSRALARVRHQVENGHDSNLRDDLDSLIEKVDRVLEGQRRHDIDIQAIRADLRVEREDRLSFERLVTGR